jgi:hypothetical protein
MRGMTKEELLAKAIKLGMNDQSPLLKGIYIIQERILHDSGYRIMNVIGHTEYDPELKDYKYYLLSECSDVINFNPLFEDYINHNFSNMRNLNMDINKHGIIHIWTEFDSCLRCHWLNVSSCMLEFVGEKNK